MRIITRPDFDGVVCAVLLMDVETIDKPTLWVSPGDVQKGKPDITDGDIIANLPFDERCTMWFDHHYTNRIDGPFQGSYQIAPSAARVIYNYYHGKFQKNYNRLVKYADKIDSADLNRDEVLNPDKYRYIILSMSISDQDYSEENYWNKLVDLLREKPVKKVLADPDVEKRCQRAVEENKFFKDLLRKHTEIQGQVCITDFRDLEKEPEGNRFLVYSMFPESVVSLKIRYPENDRSHLRISVGHSIFNRNCNVNIGLLLAEFEGGGHRAAGGSTFPVEKADEYLPKIIDVLVKNENNEPDA